MTVDNGHIAGHFSLPADTERNLTVVVEAALTELAENIVQSLIDKRFNEIVDRVLDKTVNSKFAELVQYITDHFTLSPEGTRNISLLMETALTQLATESVNKIVDDKFDSLFRTVLTETLNTRVKYVMLANIDDMTVTVDTLSNVESNIVEPVTHSGVPTPLLDQITEGRGK